MAENPRAVAVRLILRTVQDGSYTNLLLDQTLAQTDLRPADKRLCTQIFYGVIERMLTLDHVLGCYAKKPPEPVIRCILYSGLYQLLYCDRIPDSAAVNETVALCSIFRKKSASGFVNAVLRGFLRDDKRIREPEDPLLARQVRYSVPAELISAVTQDLGEETADAFFAQALLPPPVTIRRNPLRGSIEALAPLSPEPCPGAEEAYFLRGVDAAHTEAFRKGLYHVQDLAPQICCKLLGAQPGETVLDVCAAPGGKTFTIAEMMENRGTVYAFDLHPKRVKLIADGAARLGLSCITAAVQDARKPREDMPAADRILCDVPCSGYGVIRRKPEIRYQPLAASERLPEIQYAILENAAHYLKPGGTLVYATCTILRRENEAVVQRFLEAHPEFAPVPLTELDRQEGWITFTPSAGDCDGFFAARLRRHA